MTDKKQTRRNFIKVTGLGLAGIPFAFSACSSVKQQWEQGDSYMVYVGTYAKPEDDSIFGFRLNPATGELTQVLAAKGGENPSFLILDAPRQHLYAVNEITNFNNTKSGAISAFAVDQKSGELSLLNQQSTNGGAPCYVSRDQSEKLLLVANYVGGNVCVFPILPNKQVGIASDMDQHIGSGKNKKRQEAPHAHCIIPDPDNQFAFAVDLGLDKVLGYRLNAKTGQLTLDKKAGFSTRPGAGPRHLTFHPNGNFAYLINELNSTMTALTYNADKGSFQEIETVSTLPEDFKEESFCADVHVSPDGKFLYGSNRGHNSIVVFAIDAETGKLTLLQHADTQGEWPRNFAIDTSGQVLLVANQNTNNIVTYRINPLTGMLTPSGFSVEVPSPVCIQVVRGFS